MATRQPRAEPRIAVRQDPQDRPSGSNSASNRHGIPSGNPFVGKTGVLGEIYVYGLRNPQRFGWDARNGNLFIADISQNIVEELSVARAGANLGWNKWEGSFGFVSREAVSLANRRSDPSVTYPVVEYGQLDPLLQTQSAVTGVHVYRNNAISPRQPRAVRRLSKRRDLLYSGRQVAVWWSGRDSARAAQRRWRAENVPAGHSRKERQARQDPDFAR